MSANDRGGVGIRGCRRENTELTQNKVGHLGFHSSVGLKHGTSVS